MSVARGPDFLCIGAQKAGTTWLHENLSQHGGIWLPPVKELHVLDHEPPDLRKRLFGKASHHRLARLNLRDVIMRRARGQSIGLAASLVLGARDAAWYDQLFTHGAGKVKGEICPGYARISVEGVRTIHSRYPEAKIIYLLRDPVARAWSSMAMHYRKDGEDSVNEHGDHAILAKLKTPKSQGHWAYEQNINSWTGAYPRAQVYFGFFDRIAEDADAYLRDILGFLGVEGRFAPRDARRRVNAGKGEAMSQAMRYGLSSLLLSECEAMHFRFGNPYTERWLADARAAIAAGPGGKTSPVLGDS
jgi:hypothetical protein